MDRIPNKGLERRELRVAGLRVDGETRSIAGHAATFNQETVIAGLFREVIRPGAFKRALAEGQDVVAWYQHGKGAPLPLGRTTATPPTLRLAEDERGLRFEIDPPATQSADELREAIKRGDVTGMSFAFDVRMHEDENWDDSEVGSGKLPLRELLNVDLFDVSPVVFPAYQGTSVHARSAEEVLEAHKPVAVPETPAEPEQSCSEPQEPNADALEVERATLQLQLL
jgi:HK97 family phage prohead protease